MTLHEELEKYIREKRELFNTERHLTGRTSFTKDCGYFGSTLRPSASANNVWRWCKKGRVPNKRYHASILEKTGIDFRKAVREPKPIPATTCVIPVDFQDLQWVYAETPCVGCFIDGGSDECENAVRAITGLKCKSRNFVLKRKPTWEVCTKQNTKVGDVVRRLDSGAEWTVKYILTNEIPENMVVNFSGVDEYCSMRLFEVEI